MDGLLRQEVVGDVLDVVAVVEGLAGGILRVGRPAVVARLEALGAQLRALGQRVDLHAGVVVIELAVDLDALGGQQLADGIAQCGLAAVAHVQRAGGVGADELDQHLLGALRLAAEGFAGGQHFAHHLLLGLGLEADVEEAGAGNVDGRHPLLVGRLRLERGLELLTQRARILLERLGQLHGSVGGPVAVRGLLGLFESGPGTGARAEFFQLGGEGGEQFLFDLEHGGYCKGGRAIGKAPPAAPERVAEARRACTAHRS